MSARRTTRPPAHRLARAGHLARRRTSTRATRLSPVPRVRRCSPRSRSTTCICWYCRASGCPRGSRAGSHL